MLGVSATDSEDGDLTSSVTHSGTVDVNTPGDYTVTYEVVDSGGLSDSKEQLVTVSSVAVLSEEAPKVTRTRKSPSKK